MRPTLVISILLYLHLGVRAQSEPTLDITPNPFVDTTTITFSLFSSDTVSLVVYDQFGGLIDSIINEQLMPIGTQSIQFVGDTLLVGTYFAYLDVDTHFIAKQLVKVGQLTLNTEESRLQTSDMFVYPNPTTGKITLTNLPKDANSIAVYNSLGEMVYCRNLSGSTESSDDLSTLSSGIYIIEVLGSITTLKTRIIKY